MNCVVIYILLFQGPDNERVMCMACRGVYPSRRSLTGHIGRNEKCREIIGESIIMFVGLHKAYRISSGNVYQASVAFLGRNIISGRNYLDQVAMGANPIAPGTENAIKAGALTNGQDGLSPICPHCDRFISHYKVSPQIHFSLFFSVK